MDQSQNLNSNLVEFINGQIWAIVPERLEALIVAAAGPLPVEKKTEKQGKKTHSDEFPADIDEFDGYGVKKFENVAIVNIEGVIVKDFNWYDKRWFGLVSTQMIAKDFNNAVVDSAIDTIILHIDSPGGTVDGTKELADLIYNARDKGKTIITYANGMMASGGYYIGSSAHKVYTYDTSYIGSIGVYRPHIDASKYFDRMGLTVTLIHAGKYKVVGNPYEKLSDDDKKIMQAEVDKQYQLFVDTVARNRGVSAEKVKTDMAEGRVFIGQQAVDAGLVDGLATFEEVIQNAQLENKAKSRLYISK